jgi:uncharacterized membrane protein
MTLLILAALFWIGVHVGLSGTALRGRAVAAVGEKRFMIGFSVTSVVAIVLLVLAWQNAETTFLWAAGPGLRWGLAVLMLPAFVLFMASHKRNPTAVGAKGLGEEPRGIQRITRHPCCGPSRCGRPSTSSAMAIAPAWCSSAPSW